MSFKLRFLDLCCGIGGFHQGVIESCQKRGIDVECVDAFDIKSSAVQFQKHHYNFELKGDITVANFAIYKDQVDLLCCGFPCQPFSNVGRKRGLTDKRNIFPDVVRAIDESQPTYFLLENVEGLMWHGTQGKRKNKDGPTMTTIIEMLNTLKNYKHVTFLMDASKLGVPQKRKRVIFFGVNETKRTKSDDLIFQTCERFYTLNDFQECSFSKIMEHNVGTSLCFKSAEFAKKLIDHHKNDPSFLNGKTIRDYRGGSDNIATWDFNLKGETSTEEKIILIGITKHRRQKQMAKLMHVKWKDGIPLCRNLIHKFCSPFSNTDETFQHLDKLHNQGYLKKLITFNDKNEELLCFDICHGQLLYPIYKIVDPEKPLPTLTSLDTQKLWVLDTAKLRPLTKKEIIRAFGFPDSYLLTFTEMSLCDREFFDLLGNSVPPSIASFFVDVLIQ